ncbi:MAG: RNA polymerase sigma factor [Candidatus Dormibacteria bacterium]
MIALARLVEECVVAGLNDVDADRLLRLARGILGDYHEAEDAVQDALVIAWKHWGQLRDTDRRDAWLMRICVRRCLRMRSRLPPMPVESVPEAPAPDDARWAEWDGAFARLSPQQRAVVLLHYRLDYTLDEAAHAMGCRPGSARRHLSRALERLRKEIER